jgi:anti-sigma factor (TIGR02949 family)
MSHTHSYHLTCQDLLGNLSAYIDGDLNGELCAEIRRHMAGCENCRIVFDTLTKTIYLYHESAQQVEIPVEVRGRLFETLHLDEYLKPGLESAS